MVIPSRAVSKFPLSVILLIAGALPISNASATEACVSSSSALFATLVQAGLLNQPYKIKIVQGTYAMPGDLNFNFVDPITVEGGYTQNCASRVVDPANTVINVGAGHQFAWNQYSGSPSAEINVEGITFSNATNGMSFQAGEEHTFSNDEGSVSLKQVRITGSSNGGEYSAVAVHAVNGRATLENVLFDHFTSSNICMVVLDSIGGASVDINHMTADLPMAGDSNDGRICIFDNASSMDARIYNSILWSSTGAHPIFGGVGSHDGSTQAFINDVFAGAAFHNPSTIQNQINADPLWIDPANGNYRLKTSPVSPGINTGTTQIFGGEPSTDIEGHIRVIGSAPDRGAYESAFNNQSVLVVTNTFDSGPGSLRQAMLDANSSPSIAKFIQFDIRDQNLVPICPAVITLNSTLPAVDSTMNIDGYTQAGSTKNTDANVFNANLCVMLKPTSGTLGTGLRVSSSAGAGASLTLRGLGLGGFGQPLLLLGGQSHVIAGNQFGGVAHGVTLPGAGLSTINVGVNATGSLIVGGINAADRNVIGGAATSGVSIQSTVASSPGNCQVVNNLVGLAPNGVSALANGYGIQISGSGCSVARNRVAGNTIANLFIQGDDNVVQQNLVGFNIQNNGFFTNTTGILVSGSGNILGASVNGGTITANTVRYNIAGGIVVKGDTAFGNSINANLAYENGNNSDGMDIDLWPTNGVAGPTPNDASDLDSGPNSLQNFPVPKSLAYTAAGTIDRPGTLTAQLTTIPGTYRIDVYFSNAVNLLGRRGHAEIALTHASVQVPASGTLGVALPILVPNQGAGGVISMTATNSSGATSEIGTALSTDSIFADGLD